MFNSTVGFMIRWWLEANMFRTRFEAMFGMLIHLLTSLVGQRVILLNIMIVCRIRKELKEQQKIIKHGTVFGPKWYRKFLEYIYACLVSYNKTRKNQFVSIFIYQIFHLSEIIRHILDMNIQNAWRIYTSINVYLEETTNNWNRFVQKTIFVVYVSSLIEKMSDNIFDKMNEY